VPLAMPKLNLTEVCSPVCARITAERGARRHRSFLGAPKTHFDPGKTLVVPPHNDKYIPLASAIGDV